MVYDYETSEQVGQTSALGSGIDNMYDRDYASFLPAAHPGNKQNT